MTETTPGHEDCVVRLTEDSAPRIIPYGEGFLRTKLPAGTRCIYPPDPVEAVPDVRAAVHRAIHHPEGCEPLYAQLKPGMRVTIAIDDISIPLPPMKRPDVRQVIIESVLDLLADHGIEDIELIWAISLHRRVTPSEALEIVGPRVFREYYPDRLYNHDAEDPDGLVRLGETDHGEPVILNRRAVESDLLVYVNVNFVPMDGGHKSVAVGLTNWESLRSHHDPDTILECDSYMDPDHSALHHSCARMGEIVNRHLNVFHVETTVNNRMYGDLMSFLARKEDDFTTADEWSFRALDTTLKTLPRAAKRALFHRHRAPYGVTGVHAGRTEPVHERTLEACYRQYAVPVEGQADVLISGVPYLCPYNVNSIMNPLLVHCTGLGYFFNMYRGKPLIREGGVLILCHPLYDDFHSEHHAPYVEFFHRLLSETRDSKELQAHEESFAKDPAYVNMYRNGYAYHGAHPFYMWYWGEAGRAHVGRTICVGAESTWAADVLGWDVASTVDEALAMAADEVGADPEVTLMRQPPLFLTDVS